MSVCCIVDPKNNNNKKPSGICSAIIDDANHRVYLYGDVYHENYHQPGNQAVPYVAVESAGYLNGVNGADEFFDGVQEGNNIVLAHTPIVDKTLLVFLNGIKQRSGAEHDYTVSGNTIHFNFYSLLATDTVEVNYEYGAN